MKRKQTAGALALFVLVIQLLIGATGCTASADSPGQIELSASEFHFGTVPNDKPVSQVFQVRNTGRGTLEILGVSTSCGCTTAEIDENRLAPGATANLTVTYDPQVHDGATDEFTRVVYIRSNDPEASETMLTVRVKVVDPHKETN
jgi:hypothetical protein